MNAAENDATLTALIYDAPMPPETPGVSVPEAMAIAGAVLAAGYVPAASIVTHNGTPVTPENLRYAATHEAMCRSWIFDVLTGLADTLDTHVAPPAPQPCSCGHDGSDHERFGYCEERDRGLRCGCTRFEVRSTSSASSEVSA